MQVAHYHLQSSHSDIHTVFDPHSKVEKILKSFALETAKSKERFLKESAVSIVLCTKSIDIYTAENCFIHDNIGYLTYPKINKMKPITHYRLPEQKLKTIFKTLCKAVRECHKHGIAHRDIRTTNILYDIENDAIKLKGFENADFWGLSKKLSGAFGRKFYSAPETFTQHSYDGEKADMWSLGVVLHELLTGKLPFSSNNYKDYIDGNVQLCSDYKFSDSCVFLLNSLLQVNPAHRITSREIFLHPWFSPLSR